MKCTIILKGWLRFDRGTHVTILGPSKFVILADEIHNKIYPQRL